MEDKEELLKRINQLEKEQYKSKRNKKILLIVLLIIALVIIGYIYYSLCYNVGQLTNSNIENSINSTDDSSFSSLDDLIEDTSSTSIEKTYLGDYEVKGTMSISTIDLEYPILEKVTVNSLQLAPAILDIASCDEITETITELNVKGTNTLIFGDSGRENYLSFSSLDELILGDIIEITDNNTGKTITYTIYDIFYTSSSDISFMEKELDPNTREITLKMPNTKSTDASTQSLIICAKEDNTIAENFLNSITDIIPSEVVINSIETTSSNHIVIEAQSEKYYWLSDFKELLSEGFLINVESSSGSKIGDVVTITIEGDLP